MGFRQGMVAQRWLRMLLLALALVLGGCGDAPPANQPVAAAQPLAEEVPRIGGEPPASRRAVGAKYIGSAACAECHQAEYQAWLGSHHQRAMQVPTAASIAADFQGATAFVQDGKRTEFSQGDGRYLIRTEGSDGRMASFEVRHAFGAEPLQQYLLPLPGGRLQAFRLAWDTAKGQWFDLHPTERNGPEGPLHWTGLGFNWNLMCADCHSTAVAKGYDAATRSYDTSFAEVSVGCEACHGPGGAHAAGVGNPDPGPAVRRLLPSRAGSHAAEGSSLKPGFVRAQSTGQGPGSSPSALDADQVPSYAQAFGGESLDNTVEGIGQRPRPALVSLREPAAQINACAPCHSRRSQLRDGFRPHLAYFDYYSPALLDDGLYHADGQILDEVYVYGSFLQSRMHQAGVTCGHCHEPHSAQLRLAGDALCTSCHNEAGRPDFPSLPLGRYDHPQHHLHGQDSPSARCVNCHMPARTYMVLDDRRDHSFRIPRPDLQSSTEAPDPCTSCHQDRSPSWAAEVLAAAFGPPKEDHFGPVFAAARNGLPQAETPLAAIAQDQNLPPIVRGTALALTVAYARGVTGLALEKGLNDPEPLVRIGALRGAARWPPQRRWRQAKHLLQDELLAVRSEAAPLLAPSLSSLPQQDRAPLRKGLAEYLQVQEFNADRPEAHTNIGNLHVSVGEYGLAEATFKTALELNPNWVPALVNLADLHRRSGRDAQAGNLLLQAADIAPEAPDVLLARAFWLVRQRRSEEALPLFTQAHRLVPNNARYAYTYALALHSQGRSQQALDLLDKALAERPSDAQLLEAAAGIAMELGWAKADNSYLQRLRDL